MASTKEYVVYEEGKEPADPQNSLNKKVVKIVDQGWNRQIMKNAVVELKCETLIFRKRENHLGKLIESINFPSLKVLNISDSGIQSLESFGRLMMPQLSELFLTQNHLTKIRPVVKGSFPKLFRFSVHNNDVKDGKELTKGAWKIRNLSFDLISADKEGCEDIRFAVKLLGSLQYIWVKSKFRLRQNRLEQVFSKNNEIRIFS